jgi:hypothetical protein
MDHSVAGFDYWMGVGCINNYAMFLGYMSMGVRGLGLLVLMWSTIIILSGFITLLQKDFWSLVVIMLIQIAGLVSLPFDSCTNLLPIISTKPTLAH